MDRSDHQFPEPALEPLGCPAQGREGPALQVYPKAGAIALSKSSVAGRVKYPQILSSRPQGLGVTLGQSSDSKRLCLLTWIAGWFIINKPEYCVCPFCIPLLLQLTRLQAKAVRRLFSLSEYPKGAGGPEDGRVPCGSPE